MARRGAATRVFNSNTDFADLGSESSTVLYEHRYGLVWLRLNLRRLFVCGVGGGVAEVATMTAEVSCADRFCTLCLLAHRNQMTETP